VNLLTFFTVLEGHCLCMHGYHLTPDI